MADHCLLIAGLTPLQKVQGQPLSSSQKAALQEALRDWELWLDRCESLGGCAKLRHLRWEPVGLAARLKLLLDRRWLQRHMWLSRAQVLDLCSLDFLWLYSNCHSFSSNCRNGHF